MRRSLVTIWLITLEKNPATLTIERRLYLYPFTLTYMIYMYPIFILFLSVLPLKLILKSNKHRFVMKHWYYPNKMNLLMIFNLLVKNNR